MEITISHLTKDYGKFRALDDISVHIPGGMFGLLGPNGAGKTTLMRILTTLLKPTSGQVTIGSYNLLTDPGEIRRRLGYLPQEFGFYRSLTAFEMLEYIAALKNVPVGQHAEQARAALAEVNLLAEARRKVGSFSGGMRQRLGIAQALLGGPDFMVVDEPTAGLDPEERIRFRNLLARLAEQRTVLLSTHIVADIEASCTGLAVLDRGRLVFYGSPAALREKAEGVVWQVEAPAERWPDLEARYPVLSTRAVNGRIHARLLADQPPLANAQPLEPGVEDGYVMVMRANQAQQETRHA
ncbi:MAG: ABC transporter ATP-binding protein [Anaerolineaceae bacterium]|jgi:ABC-type multidrug transport system ATPase subunit